MINYSTLKEENYNELQRLYFNHWRDRHPFIANKNLFLWQYLGFGANNNLNLFKTVFDDDRLIGARGGIPFEFIVPASEDSSEIKQGAGCSMWMVHPDYRGKSLGIGYNLHKKLEESVDVILAIGANPITSVPLFRRNNYFEKLEMNRYIIPLNPEFSELLTDNYIEKDLTEWLSFNYLKGRFEPPKSVYDIAELSQVWKNSIKSSGVFALNRSEEFWKWRYLDSPVYKYHIFGGKNQGGIIVARIAKAIEEISSLSYTPVLRIIECIPENHAVWKGTEDEKFKELIIKVLSWGVERKCVAADFYCVSNILAPNLFSIGFREQSSLNAAGVLSLICLFDPIVKAHHKYNFFIKFNSEELQNKFDVNNSYIIPADTDQDRPNILLPMEFYE